MLEAYDHDKSFNITLSWLKVAVDAFCGVFTALTAIIGCCWLVYDAESGLAIAASSPQSVHSCYCRTSYIY
jgi:hypothetical protein